MTLEQQASTDGSLPALEDAQAAVPDAMEIDGEGAGACKCCDRLPQLAWPGGGERGCWCTSIWAAAGRGGPLLPCATAAASGDPPPPCAAGAVAVAPAEDPLTGSFTVGSGAGAPLGCARSAGGSRAAVRAGQRARPARLTALPGACRSGSWRATARRRTAWSRMCSRRAATPGERGRQVSWSRCAGRRFGWRAAAAARPTAQGSALSRARQLACVSHACVRRAQRPLPPVESACPPQEAALLPARQRPV